MNRFANREYGLVFAGGAVGSLLRYIIGGLLELTVGASMAGSLSLVIVNVAGALALGVISSHPRFTSEDKQSFWAAGFCGGFTTMSGVALFLYQPQSIALTTVMFGLGFIGFALGVNLGKASGTKK